MNLLTYDERWMLGTLSNIFSNTWMKLLIWAIWKGKKPDMDLRKYHVKS